MNRTVGIRVTVLTLLLLLSASLTAGISATTFGDYYFVLKHPAIDAKGNKTLEGLNGFLIRRVYFTYDADLSDKIRARARLELNADGKYGTSALSIAPVLKDAWISYQFLPNHKLILGIQDSLTWATLEKFYGYRHVEKTAFDLYKVRSSRDTGLTLSGSLDSGKKLSYAVQYGNYSGNKTEIDKYKQVAASFTFAPTPQLTVEVNADMATLSATKKSYLTQAWAGFKGDWGRVAVNYGKEIVKEEGKDDLGFGVFSAFAVAKMGTKLEALARYDLTADPQRYGQDQYTLIEKGFKTRFLLLGLAWNVHPKLQLMPNLKVVSYRDNGSVKAPGSATYFNVTFNYAF